jgi:hypothetical protein
MTKDRARKQATRARAALTGERYVVAKRATEERPPRDYGRLHDLTHRMPGVPAHVDGGLQARAPRSRNPKRVHRQPQHDEPRMLVVWQGWISRRFGTR